jgi:hypothetical protein
LLNKRRPFVTPLQFVGVDRLLELAHEIQLLARKFRFGEPQTHPLGFGDGREGF